MSEYRTKQGHKHREAFCLMWYQCGCGHQERIWNSRDGVTPFTCSCPSCGGSLTHVRWNQDQYEPHYQPFPRQRIFRDGTPDEAELIIRSRYAYAKQQGRVYSQEDIEQHVQNARDPKVEDEFREGWPMISTAITTYAHDTTLPLDMLYILSAFTTGWSCFRLRHLNAMKLIGQGLFWSAEFDDQATDLADKISKELTEYSDLGGDDDAN